MKVEEIRRVYITFTKEEKEILYKATELIDTIRDNMDEEDELAFIDEMDIITDLLDSRGLENISELLFGMTECSLEIM